jgi:predicted permease
VAGLVALPSVQYSENYPDADALHGAYQRLVTHLEAIPGAEAVGLASSVPFGQVSTDTFVSVEGRPTAREGGRAHVWFTRANEGYFNAMGIRVLEGRGFAEADRVNGRDVAVVNAAFVRQYLGGGQATGVRIATGPDDDLRWWDIVGVSQDVRFFDLSRPESPALYLPTWAEPSPSMYVVVRTPRDALSVMPDLRNAITAFDPELALTDMQAMGERVAAQLMVPRTVSVLTLMFAVIALALAAIGVYGTLAQAVLQRTREFGVRRALGAPDNAVFAQVVRQGLSPVAVGLVLGVPLALLLGHRLAEILYSVSPGDPRAWGSAIAALLAVAAVAAALPGRRAMRVEPIEALRYD